MTRQVGSGSSWYRAEFKKKIKKGKNLHDSIRFGQKPDYNLLIIFLTKIMWFCSI
jgi:hypothetical protein